VGLARHAEPQLTPPKGAGDIGSIRADLEVRLLDAFLGCVRQQPFIDKTELDERLRSVRNRVVDLLDSWRKVFEDYQSVGVELQYQKYELKQPKPLLREMLDEDLESEHHRKFRANRSLRDVEPEVNLLLKDLRGVPFSRTQVQSDSVDSKDTVTPQIDSPQDLARADNGELQLSDLEKAFPSAPFVLRTGSESNVARMTVTPVSPTDVQIGDWVVLASAALHQRGKSIPALIGKFSMESRRDARSNEPYVLITVRDENGRAQARLSEDEWQNLTTIGVVKDQA
jgi:hypothetical protein